MIIIVILAGISAEFPVEVDGKSFKVRLTVSYVKSDVKLLYNFQLHINWGSCHFE